jgi:serine/threonine-protein kinase
LNLPTQFGPYLLLERISVGGMAEVYKAKEYGVEGFERTVAVKRILPHVAEDDEFIAMFKDEAMIAVQLNHGNIAQIYNLGNEQDSFYIALEYVNGRDLRAIFQKCQQQSRPMPVAQACYVIMKICEGLDYAHNKKDKYNRELHIVHRDVSPPNILVSFEGEVKLIDFGVAKAAGRASRTQAGILKGKFGYMSPEQVRGMPLDRRSDVFSVGVVLFEILTGNRLFQAETDFATLEKVRAVDVPRPSSLNPEIAKPLENIIYKALAREPEQRYQSAIELHDELQAFMFAQGLFYSRKDLAAWMRQQYAREIELEKEKAAASVPPPADAGRRKTMMMPTTGQQAQGGGGPPPPPPGARKPPPPPPGAAATPPPPPPRAPTPAAEPRAGNGAAEPTEDSDLRPRRAVKRKTMVMTTARPNLPPPPGGGPPKPRPRPAPAPPAPSGPPVAAAGGAAPSAAPSLPPPMPPRPPEAPTVPVGGPPAASASPPKPNGARPKPTQSYATTGSRPGNGEFDWDDEELETRLFGDSDAPTVAPGTLMPPAPPRVADRPGQVGGELDAAIDIDLSEPPTLAQPSVAVATATPQGRTVVPMPAAPSVPAPAPQVFVPPTHNPYPPAPQPSSSTMPMPTFQGGPPSSMTVPMPVMQMPGPPMPQAMAAPVPPMMPSAPQHMPPMMNHPPMAPPAAWDDDRPARSSAGLVFGILAAAIVLVGVGFAGVYMYSQRNTGGGDTTTQGGGDSATPRSALTLQTTPADAQVEVDGTPVAGTSPFVVSGLQPGKHRVKVSREGYLALEREVDVGAGGLNLPVSLAHRDVTLLLESDPPGAAMSLIVGGQAYPMGSGGAQYKLTREPAATYQVEASAQGYLTTRVELAFSGEPAEKVKLTLARDNSAGVAVAPPATPPSIPPSTPVGVQSPPATPPSTPPSTPSTPSTKPSKPKPPKPTPPPAAAKTSTLKIGINPGLAPATVYVDGKLAGTTPVPNFKVSPGKHKVKWRWPDGREVTMSVDISDGEIKVIKAG